MGRRCCGQEMGDQKGRIGVSVLKLIRGEGAELLCDGAQMLRAEMIGQITGKGLGDSAEGLSGDMGLSCCAMGCKCCRQGGQSARGWNRGTVKVP